MIIFLEYKQLTFSDVKNSLVEVDETILGTKFPEHSKFMDGSWGQKL